MFLIKVPTHIKIGISNWICRIINLAVQLVTIPMLINGLGTQQYAAYTILLSMMGWFALLDLGMGASLQNISAEARVRGQNTSGEIGVVALLAALVTFTGGLIVVAFSPFAGPYLLGGIGLSSSQGTMAFMVAGLLFLTTAVGNISYRLLYGLGHGLAANALNALCSVLSLAMIWGILQRFEFEALLIPALVGYALPSAVIWFAMGVFMFKRYGIYKKPDLFHYFTKVWQRTRGFMLISILSTCVLNVDYLIMSIFLNAEQITTYSILSKFFGLVITLHGGLLSASSVYWTEIIVIRDWKRLLASLRWHVTGGLSVVLLILLLVIVAAEPLLNYLVPGKLGSIPTSTILLFGIYSMVRVWTDTFTLALQAANATKILLRLIPLQAIVSIFTQLLLVRWFDVDGIILGLLISFILTVSWVLPLQIRKLSKSHII